MTTMTVEEVRARARALGADLVGVADWAALEAVAPEYDKPSAHSVHLTRVIVLGRRILTGVAACSNRALQQYNLGRTVLQLEETASKLAYWLESRKYMAVVLSTLVPDSRTQPPGFASPAGQGSLLIRQAAVQAGLGSLGLNGMLLTPEFGPRLFLMGVLTNLDIEAGSPMERPLCLGPVECGRCINACPVQAIPRQLQTNAPNEWIKVFRADTCASQCQPHGPESLVSFLLNASTTPVEQRVALIQGSDEAQRLFHGVTALRHGAFTGCIQCELACPVGRDYSKLESRLTANP